MRDRISRSRNQGKWVSMYSQSHPHDRLKEKVRPDDQVGKEKLLPHHSLTQEPESWTRAGDRDQVVSS